MKMSVFRQRCVIRLFLLVKKKPNKQIYPNKKAWVKKPVFVILAEYIMSCGIRVAKKLFYTTIYIKAPYTKTNVFGLLHWSLKKKI